MPDPLPPPRTRLYVTAPLAVDATVSLGPAQTHYLRHVLRLPVGARVALFNGHEGEWCAQLTTLGKDHGTAQVEMRLREQTSPPDLWLLFAPLKREGIDLIAEKATELGVRRLCPVFTRHTDVSRVNLERMRANTVEAAQQCGRLEVPAVAEPVPLPEMIETWPEDRLLFVCAEKGEASPVGAALEACERHRPAGLLTGPEGGFAEAELEALARLPSARFIRLGPRILRAETAVFAALACWQALCGDWRR